MVGSLENARVAIKSFATSDDTFLLSADGTTRTVYLIGGIVYKVEGTFFDDVSFKGINQMEFTNYLCMKDNLPDMVKIPEMELYEVDDNVSVIACEYIDGPALSFCFDVVTGLECSTPDMCLTEYESDILSRAGMNDLYGPNVIKKDGVLYMIDIV